MSASKWIARTFTLALLAVAAPAAGQPAAAQPSAQAAAAPADAPVSIEDFARLPFLSDALLSPDGTRIAARVSAEGRQYIAIWLPDSDRQAPRMIQADSNEAFRWAGDNRLLITSTALFAILVDQAVFPIRVQRVMSYDLTANKATDIGPGAGFFQDIIFVDPAGRYILLSSQTFNERSPNVLRIDLATGESVEVQPRMRGVYSWFADNEGVVRVGVDYGERRTRTYYRASGQAPLSLVETRRNLADDSVIDMIRFITNANSGLIVTNAETGRFGIYEYDFTTDTRGRALFTHPEVDVTSGIFNREGGLDGVVYEDDRPRVSWFNPEMQAIQRQIDRTFAGKTNVIVNSSRDGNRVLVYSSAADDPGTYYVFDRAARRMETFASPYADLIGRRFAPTRHVSYQSRDGLTIRGYLTLPPGRPQRDLPLIVLPHGGPFLRDSWSFDPQVQFLVSRGYAVLQPNFRGSTGYGRYFVERGYGQLGAGMIDDIDDGVEWAIREGIADRARVCIMGSSYGGYAAIWGAMRSPQRYRCAISFAGPTDLRAMMRHDRRYFLARRYVRERQRQLEGDERADLNAISPQRHPEMLRVPTLIAHGERDMTVPVDQSQRLLRALSRNGDNPLVESAFYPKSAHGFTDASESADYLRRVEAFLARHNPAAPAAAPAAPEASR